MSDVAILLIIAFRAITFAGYLVLFDRVGR